MNSQMRRYIGWQGLKRFLVQELLSYAVRGCPFSSTLIWSPTRKLPQSLVFSFLPRFNYVGMID